MGVNAFSSYHLCIWYLCFMGLGCVPENNPVQSQQRCLAPFGDVIYFKDIDTVQTLADGLKLILKEPISPSSANFSLFRSNSPVATFMLSLVAWAIVPFDYGLVLSDPNIGLLYLFSISLLGVYGIIIASRLSN
ncbi:NADH-ubiquinone oxidoreductase chain 1-like [Ricinus communis]|uniref:NADH-ubiquinone oxidoreductase chain 1-like n=1 Tax=Ricinus communis TaxID=3988 RepID=UPI00201AA061|nr:NADH-ubiquinone oxidoreductase chain 1-like [Ricinus communis]